MSIDAIIWAWSQPIAPAEKLVLLAMADRADEHSKCKPSMARLQNDTGLDLKTIQTCLEAMCMRQIILPEPKHSRYALCGVQCRENR